MQVDSFVLSKAAQRKSPRVLQERSDPHYDYRRESPVSLEMQSKALDKAMSLAPMNSCLTDIIVAMLMENRLRSLPNYVLARTFRIGDS